MPTTIYDFVITLGDYEDIYDVGVILYSIYWLQFSCNFFIYAARNKTFRQAYVFFIKEVRIHTYVHESVSDYVLQKILLDSIIFLQKP